MNNNIKAKSFWEELTKLRHERGLSLPDVAKIASVDKKTLYNIESQEHVQIGTVYKITKALNVGYKIDNHRNVTFVKEDNRSLSEYEPHRISVLRNQLKQELEELEPDSIESLGEIIRNLRIKHGSKIKNKSVAEVEK